MAIEVNDSVRKKGTRKVLESAGTSLADAAFGVTNDASYNKLTDGDGAHDVILDFSGAFSIAPANGVIYVHLRLLNIDGVNDSDAPDANYTPWRIWIINLNDVTATQYQQIYLHDVPDDFDIYLENQSGQSLSPGWTVAVTPVTSGPKAA